MWNERTKSLVGEENIKKLENAFVTVVGVGGVGGYVALFLARAGISKFTLIDFDKVEESNINRQIVATKKTIGKLKTEILKDMLLEINPNISVKVFSERLKEENVEKLIQKDTFCVDCIDSVADKVALIEYCYQNKIPIVSSMGAGNRIDIPDFKVMDIYKTSNDGLAKVLRKRLKEKGIQKLTVVCPSSPAIKKGGEVGSISYYPPMCAGVVSAYVVNEIIR